MKHSGISTSFSSVFVTSFNQLDRYLVVVRWWDGAHALTDSLCVRVSLLISLNVSHRIHPDPEASLKKLIRRHFFPHLKVATKKKKKHKITEKPVASFSFLLPSSCGRVCVRELKWFGRLRCYTRSRLYHLHDYCEIIQTGVFFPPFPGNACGFLRRVVQLPIASEQNLEIPTDSLLDKERD